MRMKAKLSSKGQVTIPKFCRDKLGLKTGAARWLPVSSTSRDMGCRSMAGSLLV